MKKVLLFLVCVVVCVNVYADGSTSPVNFNPIIGPNPGGTLQFPTPTPPPTIPEPGTLALVLIGGGILFLRRARSK